MQVSGGNSGELINHDDSEEGTREVADRVNERLDRELDDK